MAFEAPGFSFPFVSAANFTALSSQFKFMNIDATGKAALTGAGGRVVGVLQNLPDVNQAASLVLGGISKVKAGAAVAAGATVESDASGRAITRAAGIPAGIALEAASGADIVIAVLIVPHII